MTQKTPPWAEIVRAYRNGASGRQVQERFGIHPQTLRKGLRELGVPVRSLQQARQLREEHDQKALRASVEAKLPQGEVKQRYLAGDSIRNLAAHYRVSRDILRRILVGWGCVIRQADEASRMSAGRLAIYSDAECQRLVLAFRRLGSATKVAKEEGVNKSTIVRALRRWAFTQKL